MSCRLTQGLPHGHLTLTSPHELFDGHVLGHRLSLEMTKDDYAYQIVHHCVVFLDVLAEPSGAVVFLCYLLDSLGQLEILCLSSHVVNREGKTLLYITGGLQVPVFTDQFERTFLKSINQSNFCIAL